MNKRCKLEPKNQSQRKTIKTNQHHYGKYRIQVKGEGTTTGIHAAFGPKFVESLPTSEHASCRTAKQKEVAKINITRKGLLIKTHKSEDILVMIKSTVSKDCPFRRVDIVMGMPKKTFCPKDTLSKADQSQ